jgi:hypothetical protein
MSKLYTSVVDESCCLPLATNGFLANMTEFFAPQFASDCGNNLGLLSYFQVITAVPLSNMPTLAGMMAARPIVDCQSCAVI